MNKIFEPPMNHRDIIHQHIKLQTTMSTPITCLDQYDIFHSIQIYFYS